MAQFIPFRATRFLRPDLSGRLCVPWENLTESTELYHREQDPLNTVQLVSPQGQKEDRSKFVRFAKAASSWMLWRREGELIVDEQPGFYLLQKSSGEQWLFGLCPLSELTLTASQVALQKREDRARLFEATRAQFEPVVAIHSGESFALPSGLPIAETSTYTLSAIADAEQVREIQYAMQDTQLMACQSLATLSALAAHREKKGAKTREIPEDFALVAIEWTPDSQVMPMRGISDYPFQEVLPKLDPFFEIRKLEQWEAVNAMDDLGPKSLGLVLHGGASYLLSAKEPETWTAILPGMTIERLHSPLANVLDSLVLSQIMEVPIENVGYLHDRDRAMIPMDAEVVFFLPRMEKRQLIDLKGREAVNLDGLRINSPVPSGTLFWNLSEYR